MIFPPTRFDVDMSLPMTCSSTIWCLVHLSSLRQVRNFAVVRGST
jgi:hypothetical protein